MKSKGFSRRIFLWSGTSAAVAAARPFAAFGQLGPHDYVGFPLQPLAENAREVAVALAYLGQPLIDSDQKRMNDAIAQADEAKAIAEIEAILDPYVLCNVEINAESRVKVGPGAAKPELVEGGTRIFLVKVTNRAHVTAPLRVESPSSGNVYIQAQWEAEPKMVLTPHDAAERWAQISLFNDPPMNQRLMGIDVEYQILEVYSRDHGQRAAKIAFNVGQGSQDIGFRNDTLIVSMRCRRIGFDCESATKAAGPRRRPLW